MGPYRIRLLYNERSKWGVRSSRTTMAAGHSSGVKTRKTSGTHTRISDYLGPGKALMASELPTLRSILRQGILFKEEKIMEESTRAGGRGGRAYTYPQMDLVRDMTEAVKVQWLKANADFKPPVVFFR